ncbi:hypothetical protein EV356DRAFT_375486 [Viridothelium virens]|uniref:Uncharacterized protein n=1 Tax=Viridothelium virens TaxID=1048519 RepID=A0A6A6GVI2_VIRVR|nr:hypothetical protein EV356DRAFT_375486 [Viridothelium virens]
MATYTNSVETNQGASTTVSALAIIDPSSFIDQLSIDQVLQTTLPSWLTELATSNLALASSEVVAEFANGATPGWFASLPSGAQTYLRPPPGSNNTAPAILGIIFRGINSFTTSSSNTTAASSSHIIPMPSPATFTPSATLTSTPTSGPTPTQKGSIVGGVVGGITGLLLVLLGWFLYRRRQRARETKGLEHGKIGPV